MDVLAALANRYYTHQMFSESLCVIEFVLRHEPAVPHYHRLMGKALQALKRHDLAVQSYSKAIRLGLPDADIHFFMAQCLLYLRDYTHADGALTRCVQLAKSKPLKHAALIENAHELLSRSKALQRKDKQHHKHTKDTHHGHGHP
jgi:tetratricopeptide (TPR) repeat protein